MSTRQQLTLTDQYAVLLEQHIEESRRLREDMARKEEQHRQVLSALNSKMDAVVSANQQEAGARGSRKRRRNTGHTKVSNQCRKDFRQMYKKLKDGPDFNGFDFTAGEASHENRQVYTRVVTAICHDFGGPDKCPWSTHELKGACATYFKSLRDGQTRQQNGGAQSHSQKCRRQGRLREKLYHRLAALEKVTWSEETKEEVRPSLTTEYTSSDESAYSDDEEDPTLTHLSHYLVKSLSWQRTKLTNAKSTLDKVYIKTLDKRVRNATLPRIAHTVTSFRPVPESPLVWAVRSNLGGFMSSQSTTISYRGSVGEESLVPSTSGADSSGPSASSTPIRTPMPTPRPRHIRRQDSSKE